MKFGKLLDCVPEKSWLNVGSDLEYFLPNSGY